MATLAVSNSFSAGTTIVAADMNENFDDVEAFVNTTPGVVQNDIVDAKGDIIVATAADAVSRLAVGTDTHALVADSSEATGLKWAVPTDTTKMPLAGGAFTGAVAAGSDGSGVDVTFHSGTAGDLMLWDASDKALEFTDAKITMGDNLIETPEFIDYAESVNVIGGTGGGTQDFNIALGNVHTATVDTSTNTFTFSNPSATGKSCSFTLILTNGGSQTVNWPGAVDWAGGDAPTLTTSGVDILTFMTIDAGTIWYGFAAGLDMQ